MGAAARTLAWFAGLLLLTGCAVVPERTAVEREALWRTHTDQLSGLGSLSAEGRVAVRLERGGGQAGFEWHRAQDFQRYVFRSPWGHELARLEIEPTQARIRGPLGATLVSDDADALLAQVTGLPIPAYALTWWAVGLPVPDLKHERQLDQDGRLAELRQSDWRIRYPGYRRSGEYWLPTRVEMERQGGTRVVTVKLILDGWRPGH